MGQTPLLELHGVDNSNDSPEHLPGADFLQVIKKLHLMHSYGNISPVGCFLPMFKTLNYLRPLQITREGRDYIRQAMCM